jgi:hypothetical protein
MDLMMGQWIDRINYEVKDAPEHGPTAKSAQRIKVLPKSKPSNSQSTSQAEEQPEAQGDQSVGKQTRAEEAAELAEIMAMIGDIDLGLPGVEGHSVVKHDTVYICHKDSCRCTCQFFQSVGLLCRHLMRAYDVDQDFQLPDDENLVIHKFWFRGDAGKNKQNKAVASSIRERDTSKFDRHSRLMEAFRKLALEACTSDDNMQSALKIVKEERVRISKSRGQLAVFLL